jgi:hypothetical protein
MVADIVKAKLGVALIIALETDLLSRIPLEIPLAWFRVRHASVGGTTTGIFWIGLSEELGVLWRARADGFYCSRSLRDLIQPATKLIKGDRHVPVVPENLLVRSDGWDFTVDHYVPVKNPLGLILCPSVFTKSKWVTRHLSISELADSFDVLASVKGVLVKLKEGDPLRYAFVKGTPSKILVHVFRKLGYDEAPLEHVEDNIDLVDIDVVVPRIVAGPLGSGVEVDNLVAVKHDDAAVPVHLWNDQIAHFLGLPVPVPAAIQRLLDRCRVWLFRRWIRRLGDSFRRYLVVRYGVHWSALRYLPDCNPELLEDLRAGWDCLERAGKATWWEWCDGSRLFFWRWPSKYRLAARDGLPMWRDQEYPRWRRPQPPPRDEHLRGLVRSKLAKVRARRYVAPGDVVSLTSYFSVPKGIDDLRMVYNGTSSGLNAVLWSPNFGLPTVESTLRAVDSLTWMCDNDLGDMFLNFMLHRDVRCYVGIDLSPYFLEELSPLKRVVWERWERCLMGLRTSPFQAIQAALWCEEVIRGDRLRPNNPFHWDRLRLNLPGMVDYNPGLPLASKVCDVDSVAVLASDFFVYVDDVRPTGSSETKCWEAARRVASVSGYLGIQDAPRKRRPPSQRPGAWAGSVVRVSADGVGVTLSVERWVKTRQILVDLWEEMERVGTLDHKQLERARGFLVYIVRTYPSFNPYLKGIHLTLDRWRVGRMEDGWVGGRSDAILPRSESWDSFDSLDQELVMEDPADGPVGPPVRIVPVARMWGDVRALLRLTEGPTPPVRYVRPSRVTVVAYGFGDASKSGFGSAIQRDGGGVWYRMGVWGSDAESSNYLELCNMVDTLDRFADEEDLQDTELFLFTDNTVTESAFYRGTSSNKKLFELVLRLRRLEVRCGVLLHIIHVAGTRMIRQGADGLSRGNTLEGVMGGEQMMSFIPLHLSALERCELLLPWIRSWCGNHHIHPLTPEEWFEKGHDVVGGTINTDKAWMPCVGKKRMLHLWAPPPALGVLAIEELRRARHKRQTSTHIFVCPRLLTIQWRRALHKVGDLVFEIPARCDFWPAVCFEPLILRIILPFSTCSPWQMQRCPEVVELGRELQNLWKSEGGDARPLLRKLCQLPRNRVAL